LEDWEGLTVSYSVCNGTGDCSGVSDLDIFRPNLYGQMRISWGDGGRGRTWPHNFKQTARNSNGHRYPDAPGERGFGGEVADHRGNP
jgi:hypothetical protein